MNISRNIRISFFSAIVLLGLGAWTYTSLIDNQETVQEKVYKRDFSQRIPVKIIEVTHKDFNQSIDLLGSFKPNREIDVTSMTQGEIIRVGVEEGAWVKAGTLIAKVDDSQIQYQLISAKANYENALKEVRRYENLTGSDAVPKVQLDQAQLRLATAESQWKILQKQLEDTEIRAPFGGIVTRRMFELGTVVSPGMPLAQLTDIASLKLVVQVPEEQLSAFREGQQVQVKASIHPEVTYEGTIAMVGAKGDEAHNFPLHISVKNSEEHPLRAGMYGSLQFANYQNKQVLSIPREALLGSSKDAQVYVVRDSMAYLQPIRIGSGNEYELTVLEGLQPGEQVVVSGQINLKDQVAVSILN